MTDPIEVSLIHWYIKKGDVQKKLYPFCSRHAREQEQTGQYSISKPISFTDTRSRERAQAECLLCRRGER